MRPKSIIAWILLIVIGLLFILAGVGKFSQQAPEMFANWGLPTWLTPIIGAVEIIGGIALIIPKTTRYAVYLLSAIMVGALFTHIANGEFASILRPTIFVGIFWTGYLLRGSSEENLESNG